MSSSFLRVLARTSLVGGIALLGTATTIGVASAESRDLEYSCEYGISFGEGEEDGQEGDGPTTASWDSGITDDQTVPTGTRVDLDPFTGSVSVPEELLDWIREAEISEIEGIGATLTFIDESGEDLEVELDFPVTQVPASGPMTIELEAEDAPSFVAEAGDNTLVADAFFVNFSDDETYDGGMFCDLVDEGDITIDVVEGVGAAPTTTTGPTVTASATPTRPTVVQTDFADEAPSSLPLLAVGGAVLAAAGAVALGRGARRSAARRH